MNIFGGDSNINIADPDFKALPKEEMEVLEKAARWLVKWGAAGTMVGILVGESMRPTNFLVSQSMVFFEPMVNAIFDTRQYQIFYSALEKRDSVEVFLQMVEAYDAERVLEEKAVKVWYRYQKRKWTRSQRFIKFFRPGVEFPRWAIRHKVLKSWQDNSRQF